MPAVQLTLRWPDGQLTPSYSPSTVIFDYLKSGVDYSLDDFMTRAEHGLEAASERVRERYGYACSSAMDSLAGLRLQASAYADANARVAVIAMQRDDR